MFQNKLKELRRKSGISQAGLAREMHVSQQAVSKWEAGRAMPEPFQIAHLAEYFKVSTDYLLGLAMEIQNKIGMPDIAARVPVIGAVRAGYNAFAMQEELGDEPADVPDPAEYCYLLVKGDSMEPFIRDGDLALIHMQGSLMEGELGVFIYGDGEGTVKRFHKKGREIHLEPFNSAYETIVLKGSEIENLYIFGKVVETKTRW